MGLRSQNNPQASFRDVFSATGRDAVNAAPPGIALEGHTATGGVIGDYVVGNTIYRTHTFTSSGTFNVTDIGNVDSTVDYLVVGGGGGGGGGYEAGGGGAGGFRTTCPEGPGGPGGSESSYTVSAGSYTVTVGGGGVGGPGAHGDGSPLQKGKNGNQSAFFPTPVSYPNPSYIRSEGGGGGGTYSPGNPVSEAEGIPGGSGGGAANCHPAGPASGGGASYEAGSSTPVPTQGYRGGNRGPQAHNAYYNGAGGGGAGAAGADQNDNTLPGSFGGNGKRTSIVGPTYTIGTPGPASAGGTGGGPSTAVTGGWLAGGGGGALYGYPNMAHLPQTRGAGGGGAGGHGGSPVVDATNALQSTGSGGGASGHTGRNGGHGGSGIVVIRYQIGTVQTDTAKATGGSISFTPGGKTVHVFTGSGTFTAPAPLNPTALSVEYLVVGGGGGGGSCVKTADALGGGGAGGLRSNHPEIPAPLRGGSYAFSVGVPYTVTVGGGGSGGIHNPNAHVGMRGQSGSNSEIYPTSQPYPHTDYIRSVGGGGGGSYEANTASNRDGIPGGSGGGGAGGSNGAGGAGNTPSDPNWPIPMGNPGGARGPNFGAGGGGGFTAAGTASDGSNNPGPGGNGITLSISGSPTGYAGGGGGGACGPFRGSFTGGTAVDGGGAGAPADGSNLPTYRGDSGTMGTGGGGGGAGGSNTPEPVYPLLADGLRFGGNGGSGIVIISYPT